MLVRGVQGFEACFSEGETIVQINMQSLFEVPQMEMVVVIPTFLTRPFRKAAIRCPNRGSSWRALPVTEVFFR